LKIANEEANKKNKAEDLKKAEQEKKIAKARSDRRAQKKAELGEDYNSSGDEGNRSL
jgi:hypothetical protein